jgi:acyl homoserine lactone synthase
MIFIIDSLNLREHADIVKDMFRLRKRVFADRLGWDVQISQGMERDRFDDLDPLTS